MNRYRQILTVLAKYGFSDLLDQLRIGHYVELGLKVIGRQPDEGVEKLTRPERIRIVFETLGPTFIKLGQVLATRPDLLGQEYIVQLGRLQDHVPAFPFEQVRGIVEHELGRPLNDVFETFGEECLAAASIGQVHRARFRDGQEVAVKVQRPGISHVIEVDLEILRDLARLAERHVDGASLHRPTRIIEEFSRTIAQELDYTVEAAHMERFAEQFERNPIVMVPRVFHDATTARVLTMEFVDGIRPTDLATLESAGNDRRRVAERGATLILDQVFVHGFFHADPHPGNLFVLPSDVICYLDFGMVGRLDRRNREQIADLVYAIASREPGRAAAALLRITQHDDQDEIEIGDVERDMSEMIDTHLVGALKEIRMAKLLQQIFVLLNRHRLRIPANLVTMLKAMATVESLGAILDPDLDMITIARPYIAHLKRARFSPRRIAGDVVESAGEFVQLAREIPGGVRDLLRLAKRGGLRMGFEHRGLDALLESHERIANRISFAIVVAALIVGSSLIVHSKIPPTWHEVPIIGLAGFLTAGVMGFMLLVAIIRHGRM